MIRRTSRSGVFFWYQARGNSVKGGEIDVQGEIYDSYLTINFNTEFVIKINLSFI